MPLPFRLSPRRVTLQTRLSLGILSGVFLATFGVATIALQGLKEDMRKSIAQAQYERISRMSEKIDRELVTRRHLLADLSKTIEKQKLTQPSEFKPFFSRRMALNHSFNNVALIDLDGNLVAVLNGDSVGKPVNLKDRPYFIDTLKNGDSVISDAYLNRFSNTPQIAITQPVFDENDQIKYVMVGTIELRESNFLGTLTDEKIGQSGYMFIISDDGMIVSHPDKSRILTRESAQNYGILASKENSDKAGAGQILLRDGIKGLFIHRRMQSTPWQLAGFYPSDEAFVALDIVEFRVWMGAALMSLFAGIFSYLIIRRQLSPLVALRNDMLRARDGIGPIDRQRVYAYTNNEIGDLSRTFVKLISEIDASNEKMLKSERSLRNVLTHANDAFISVDHHGLVREWNCQAEFTFGWSRKEALGQKLHEMIIPAASREKYSQEMRELMRVHGGAVILKRQEDVAIHRNGSPISVEISFSAIDAGENRVINVFFRDITQIKAAALELQAKEKFLRDITNNLPAAIGYFDRDEKCLFSNKSARRFLGFSPENHAPGTTTYHLCDVLPEDVYRQHQPHIASVLNAKPMRFDFSMKKNSTIGHFECSMVPNVSADGQVQGFYTITFNSTALKLSEQARADGENRLRTITDNLPALISYIDHEERYRFYNRTLTTWTGVDNRTVLGQFVREAIGETAYAERKHAFDEVMTGKQVEIEASGWGDASNRILHSLYLPDVKDDGTVAGFYTLSTDITAAKKLEAQLRDLARIDALTGLPNRRKFDEWLQEALARAKRLKTPLSLMFMDLDHFKQINDTHLHLGGDEALKEFAKRIKSCVRSTDLVARYAGDEFVIVLEGIGMPQYACMVAQKIVDAMLPPFIIDGQPIRVTTSIGVAYHDDTLVDAAEFVSRADAALYKAKQQGRNTYCMEGCPAGIRPCKELCE